MPNALRASVERASLPVLTRLSTLPRLVPFVVLLVLLLGGTLVGGLIGFVLTLLGALLVAWVLYLGWPQFTGTERLMRSAVLFLVAAVAVVQLAPRR